MSTYVAVILSLKQSCSTSDFVAILCKTVLKFPPHLQVFNDLLTRLFMCKFLNFSMVRGNIRIMTLLCCACIRYNTRQFLNFDDIISPAHCNRSFFRIFKLLDLLLISFMPVIKRHRHILPNTLYHTNP